MIPARLEFVQRASRLARELDIPLIVDEVQTGCGRTGTWFAFEQYGIEPDVVVASKGLSGLGLPVSVILYRSFRDFVGPYVAHCHNLAHEDHAMMFGWSITP